MPRAKRARVTTETPVKTSPSSEKKNGKTTAAAPGLEHAIRARAYELYLERGRQDGYAQDDWLQAEAEVRSRMGRTA